MDASMWVAKTGLDAQQTRMNVISNNLANVNTTGFKRDRAVFEDLLYQNIRQAGGQTTAITQSATGLMLGTGTKVVATENSETIQQVNSKTLNVVAELTVRIKTLTDTTASQQKTITSQQQTIARLMGNSNNTGNNGGSTRNNNSRSIGIKKKCTNCGMEGFHKEEDCLELPTNEGKRKAGWKSVFDGMKNPHYSK